jgi:hypothetical protein
VVVDYNYKMIWFRIDAGNWNYSGAADPATGAGGFDISAITLDPLPTAPVTVTSATGSTVTANFGQTAFQDGSLGRQQGSGRRQGQGRGCRQRRCGVRRLWQARCKRAGRHALAGQRRLRWLRFAVRQRHGAVRRNYPIRCVRRSVGQRAARVVRSSRVRRFR